MAEMTVDGLEIHLDQELNIAQLNMDYPAIYVPKIDYSAIITKFNIAILNILGRPYLDSYCNKKIGICKFDETCENIEKAIRQK